MKKILMLGALLLLSTNCFADVVSVSKEEFENLDHIDAVLRKKYAQYEGFSGSRTQLEIKGISAAAFKDELGKIDLSAVKSDKKGYQNELKLVRRKIVEQAIAALEAEGKVVSHKERMLKQEGDVL